MNSALLLREKAIENLKKKFQENWKSEFDKLLSKYHKEELNPLEFYRRIYNDTVTG